MSLYSKAIPALQDIVNWYYETYSVMLTRGQALCYAIGTVDVETVRNIKAVATLMEADSIVKIQITSKAFDKIVQIQENSGEKLSQTVIATVVVLLKSIALPDMSITKRIMGKKQAPQRDKVPDKDYSLKSFLS